MSKIQNYILLNAEKGRDLLEAQQNEVNHYNDMTPEQIQAELDNDSGYQDFLDKLETNPF